jgi:hypothetical protein
MILKVQSIAINFVWRGVKQLQSFILNDCNLLCYFSLLISSCFVFHPLSLWTFEGSAPFAKSVQIGLSLQNALLAETTRYLFPSFAVDFCCGSSLYTGLVLDQAK